MVLAKETDERSQEAYGQAPGEASVEEELFRTRSADMLLPIFVLIVVGAFGCRLRRPCPPISDTSILSSESSGCPHLEHVRTQRPYAVTVMLCASVVCLFSVHRLDRDACLLPRQERKATLVRV